MIFWFLFTVLAKRTRLLDEFYSGKEILLSFEIVSKNHFGMFTVETNLTLLYKGTSLTF